MSRCILPMALGLNFSSVFFPVLRIPRHHPSWFLCSTCPGPICSWYCCYLCSVYIVCSPIKCLRNQVFDSLFFFFILHIIYLKRSWADLTHGLLTGLLKLSWRERILPKSWWNGGAPKSLTFVWTSRNDQNIISFSDNLGKYLCFFCKVKFSRLATSLKYQRILPMNKLLKNTYPELLFL